MDVNLIKLQEIVKDRGAWLAALHAVADARDLCKEFVIFQSPGHV